MDRYFEIKQRLLNLAETSDELLAVIAMGSYTRKYAQADEFSDLDLILVCSAPDKWLYGDQPKKLGDIIISFVEPTFAGGMERRILYSGFLDVDLILLTPEQLALAIKDGIAKEVLSRGYTVLFGSKEVTDLLRANIRISISHAIMTEAEFINIVHNFWFHAVWSAKKMRRGELWTAKMCVDAYMKGLLSKIIEVSEADNQDVWHNGRFLENWACEDTVMMLGGCFAHYDRADMRSALSNTMELFAKLARRTAENRCFPYPAEAEACAIAFVKDCLYSKENSEPANTNK